MTFGSGISASRSGLAAFGLMGGPRSSGLIFDLFGGDSGVENLPQALTINSVSVSPSVRYEGVNAGASSWVATTGTNLAIASSGTDPTLAQQTPFTGADRAVLINAGDVYQAAASTTADTGTNDFMVEIVCKVPAGTAAVLSKGSMDGVTPSWNLIFISGIQLRFQHNDAAGSSAEASVSVTPGSWIVVHAFFDASDTAGTGVRLLINGVAAGASTKTAACGTLSGGKLTVGARADFTQKFTGAVAYAAIYHSAGWFAGGATNTTQWNAIAAERCARLMGIYPSRAIGAATPTTATRSTAAHLDRVIDEGTGERRLFLVDQGWMRFCRRKELAGGEFTSGFLSEPAATNLCRSSQLLGSGDWAKITVGDLHNSDSTAAPDATTTGDTFTCANDAVGLEHGVRQAITLTAATHTFSVWIKDVGSFSHCILRNATIANGAAWFNKSTGAIGTTQAGVTARSEAWGDGWFRFSITFTGTAASHNLDVMSASADNTLTHTSSGSNNGYIFWGAQVELGALPTSYITTTSASAARVKDSLQFAGTGNLPVAAPFTMESTTIAQSFVSDGTYRYLLIGDTGNFKWAEHIDDAGGAARFRANDTNSTEWSVIAGSGDISDGETHVMRTVQRAANNAEFYVDGVSIGTDVGCSDIPATFASPTIYVGQDNGASAQPIGVLISRVRIWNRAVAP